MLISSNESSYIKALAVTADLGLIRHSMSKQPILTYSMYLKKSHKVIDEHNIAVTIYPA
jgi:hypothetical protein